MECRAHKGKLPHKSGSAHGEHGARANNGGLRAEPQRGLGTKLLTGQEVKGSLQKFFRSVSEAQICPFLLSRLNCSNMLFEKNCCVSVSDIRLHRRSGNVPC